MIEKANYVIVLTCVLYQFSLQLPEMLKESVKVATA